MLVYTTFLEGSVHSKQDLVPSHHSTPRQFPLHSSLHSSAVFPVASLSPDLPARLHHWGVKWSQLNTGLGTEIVKQPKTRLNARASWSVNWTLGGEVGVWGLLRYHNIGPRRFVRESWWNKLGGGGEGGGVSCYGLTFHPRRSKNSHDIFIARFSFVYYCLFIYVYVSYDNYKKAFGHPNKLNGMWHKLKQYDW